MAAHSSRHAQVHADAVESVYGFRHYQHKHAGHNTKQAMKGAGLYRDRNVDLALTVTGNLFRCYTGTIDDGECGRPASDTCFSVVFSRSFQFDVVLQLLWTDTMCSTHQQRQSQRLRMIINNIFKSAARDMHVLHESERTTHGPRPETSSSLSTLLSCSRRFCGCS